ncbi:lactate dehydrogenase [Klenkia taihuensis]|uniref:FAD/FMN-containing dehydrogenase n=1 Tax=Klenkia taihuensis TaxID=1225127 RepID=A0A1I1UJU3_9ACTN|nr:lactate dehydrogenase [Klenkia taihuensis]SFD70974.1 FAD/FMN-containing dehydrogenase [Klenkia taihuensis]
MIGGVPGFEDDLRARFGDLARTDGLARAVFSTDASNYRVPPRAVVQPRTRADVVDAVALAAAHGVPVTPRGGGTSCAGNAIGPGLVLDLSRHLDRVLAVDPEARTATVQPGVVLTDLQAAAAPHGLRFGPDPSTASRATLGGLIGNNACGPHGLSYGRTADNVVELTWLTGDGRVLTAGSGPGALDAVPGLAGFVRDHLGVVRTEFGRFARQISGYSLEHLLPENGSSLAAALVGTEGTCGVLLEAVVRLVPRAPAPALAVLAYPDMAAAADDVPALLPLAPLALEGLDARLVDVVRRAHGSVPDLPDGGGWLMAELGGETGEEAVEAAHRFAAASAARDVRVLPAGPAATRLWQIRADGAGLAGRTPAGTQAWPGWEDSAVPPERLGDYLRGLEALMADEDVTGLAYGHFGDGCVHVRIDFPLHTGGAPMRRFLERAADLATSHGGSLSGEHGDGRARSELLRTMYSADALTAMARFKGLLDPDDRMNPGVVVRPAPLDADLRRPHALPVVAADGFAFAADGGDVTAALHRCTGVGACRADLRGQGAFMCPSYLATREEQDSTRGRARALQEMLAGGVDGGWAAPEVHEALDLCLSCKACAADCPTGTDMATYKAETLHRTYAGRVRPRTHYTFGRLPRWLRLAAPFAAPLRAAARVGPLRRSALRAMGADPRRSLPDLPLRPFRWTRTARTHRRPTGTGTPVLLWVDSFSDGLEPAVARDAVAVLEAAGCDVVVAEPGACCGLTLVTTGQLTAARTRMRRTLAVLEPHVQAGRVVVGLEPSCTATLRSDLVELLPDDPRAAAVAAAVRTVAELLTELDWTPPAGAGERLLVQPHCHHHAVLGFDADRALLDRMGHDVVESTGCCGLAGSFGMERGHHDVSVAIARDGVLARAAEHPDRALLADGFSCRTQVRDLAGLPARHLVQLLADRLR